MYASVAYSLLGTSEVLSKTLGLIGLAFGVAKMTTTKLRQAESKHK